MSATALLPGSFSLRGSPEPDQILNAGDFTLGFAFTPVSDLTVTRFRHYSGTRISLWTTNGATLASQIITNDPGAWNETTLTNPVALKAGTRYLVGFYTGGGTYFWRSDAPETFSHGAIEGSFYASGDQYPDNPFSDGWWLADVRFDAIGPVAIAVLPPDSGNFVNGIWTGNITVTQAISGLILRAEDGTGHRGDSNPFDMAAERPKLLITRAGNVAAISWNQYTPGFVLEAAVNPASPGSWTPLTNGIIQNGSQHSVYQSVTNGQWFYRLRRPE
jgi:hypothetical protein